MARNLELRCREHGYLLLITNSDGSKSNDTELVRLLVNRGVDGLFVVVSDELRPGHELASMLEQLPVPYVMVDRFIEGLDCDKVGFNNEQGGYLATSYLLGRGHERVACLINKESNTGLERMAGYERALRERGIEPDPELEFHTAYYIDDAYESAKGFLKTDATAVFASSDNIALGLLKLLYAHDLRVPRDYSVVSYDNSAADSLEPARAHLHRAELRRACGRGHRPAVRPSRRGRCGHRAKGQRLHHPAPQDRGEELRPLAVVGRAGAALRRCVLTFAIRWKREECVGCLGRSFAHNGAPLEGCR